MDEAKRLDEVAEAEEPQKACEDAGLGGLAMVMAWVPDHHRSPEYEARLARQAAAIAGSPDEREVMGWIEQVHDTTGSVWNE